MGQEDIVATIEAMQRQEEKYYAVKDYLYRGEDDSSSVVVDSRCRAKMVQWCYNVVDYLSFQRDTVAAAMNCLDRFLSTPDGRPVLQNRKQFQIAVMTVLYTTCKIHETQVMDPALIATLSRGEFTIDHVERMERTILKALDWHVNPPTVLSFCHHYLALISEERLSKDERLAVLEMLTQWTEQIVSEYKVCLERPSTLAAAILLDVADLWCGAYTWKGQLQSILDAHSPCLQQKAAATTIRALGLQSNNTPMASPRKGSSSLSTIVACRKTAEVSPRSVHICLSKTRTATI